MFFSSVKQVKNISIFPAYTHSLSIDYTKVTIRLISWCKTRLSYRCCALFLIFQIINTILPYLQLFTCQSFVAIMTINVIEWKEYLCKTGKLKEVQAFWLVDGPDNQQQRKCQSKIANVSGGYWATVMAWPVFHVHFIENCIYTFRHQSRNWTLWLRNNFIESGVIIK